jgi:hypothetical protein
MFDTAPDTVGCRRTDTPRPTTLVTWADVPLADISSEIWITPAEPTEVLHSIFDAEVTVVGVWPITAAAAGVTALYVPCTVRSAPARVALANPARVETAMRCTQHTVAGQRSLTPILPMAVWMAPSTIHSSIHSRPEWIAVTPPIHVYHRVVYAQLASCVV